MKVAIKTAKNAADEVKEIEKRIGKLLKDMKIAQTGIIGGADLAIIIGGDGTFLRWQSKAGCPMIGVKTGGVGYYMGATPEDFFANVSKILNENNSVGRRRLLTRLTARLDGIIFPLALNEYLVSSGYVRQMFNCRLTVDGVSSVERNSGIIIYTPTGSNAFAHAAGAKIMACTGKKIGIIALAPYQGRLMGGEIIISDGEIKIECLNSCGEICADGQKEGAHKIKSGDIITIKKSDDPLKTVYF